MTQNILFIDTAMNACNIAVFNGKNYHKSFQTMPRGQAEALIPAVQNCMNAANIEFNQLNAIITTLGPGSFTGLRVGIAAAKAFALSCQCPLYGIFSFDAMAYTYDTSEPFAVLIESKRDELFIQTFNDKTFTKPVQKTAKEISDNLPQNVTVIGDAAERFIEQTNIAYPHDKASHIDAEKIINLLQTDPVFFTNNIKALYLRGADVSRPKKMPRTLAPVK